MKLLEGKLKKQNENSLNDIKLDLISLITKITDYQQLQAIYTTVQLALENTTPSPQEMDKFHLGKINIRKAISKEQIFEEQGNQSITFKEVQTLMTDEPWEQSLEGLLATLD